MSDVAVGVRESVGVMRHQGLMSIKELAIYLGRSAGWVYVNKDSLPHRKIGRLYFFVKEAIDEWLTGGRPVVQEDTMKSVRAQVKKITGPRLRKKS